MEKSLELVRQLVNDFREHEKAYLASSYQESQVRQDFVDKFFTALGWDVSHQRQKNPYEQEVKIENRMRTEGTQRRADYAFFISPNFRDVKFFVEAKKPAHDLANANYYYQTVRYGWNKTTPIAVLTDFEEFHIIDCRYKPDIKNALNYKIETFHYSQYTDEEIFKKIFYLFGRDAVAGGSLEKFAETLLKPRGKGAKKGIVRGRYQQVDEAFLELLDGYRDTLAHAFKNKNPQLDGESLTEAVQRTLDRLVFVRFLEDKGIEEQAIANFRPLPNLPLGKGKESSAWDKFLALCKSMEPKYNGLVFKQHPVIDSPTFIAPDDKMFGEICGDISDPTSPYDFNTIPISILGSIYERFLGKIVTTTDKRAKVIEKPEVRKAGGVYYTPEYIVRYIVNETVGKLLYEEQGIGVRGEGIGVQGLEIMKGENDGVTIVQGIGSMETGNVVGGRNLQAHDAASQGGTIRTEEPNATSGGLNSGEHSGGIRTGESEGIPSVPVVRTGIVDGIGNTSGNSNTGYSAESGTNHTGNIPDGRSGKDAHAPNTISQNPLDPKPYSLFPKLTLKQVEDLKIIDIACGSGSFLLEVYSQLLDYHTRYYNEFPEKAKKGDTETREGKIVLSHKKRQEILVNNIYGVDIDFQATEVTQLSLYLKLMEDVTMNDAYQFSLLKERMLPDLRRNIVCGNSLIGRDILDGKLFDDETEHTLKPMNFEDVFPEIMNPSTSSGGGPSSSSGQGPVRRSLESRKLSGRDEGGFDVVVGNPPYGAELTVRQRDYLEKKFRLNTTDTAALMMKQAFQIIKKSGRIGFIVPKPFTYASNWESIRQLLLNDIAIIVDVSKVWREVKLEQVIFISEKGSNSTVYDSFTREGEQFKFVASVDKVVSKKFKFIINGLSDEEIFIGTKVLSVVGRLGEITVNQRGGMFQSELSNKGSIKVLGGKQLNRYSFDSNPKGYIGKKKVDDIKAIVKENSVLAQNIVAHIQNPVDHIKIIAAILPNSEREQSLILDTVNQIECKSPYSNRFVLALLCSNLMNWYVYRFIFAKAIRTMHFDAVVTDRLPIRTINFEDPADKARHDRIVSLVEQMLAAKAKHASATTESEKNRLDIQIEALDRQIDEAVYELYGLTEEEIEIVEGK